MSWGSSRWGGQLWEDVRPGSPGKRGGGAASPAESAALAGPLLRVCSDASSPLSFPLGDSRHSILSWNPHFLHCPRARGVRAPPAAPWLPPRSRHGLVGQGPKGSNGSC